MNIPVIDARGIFTKDLIDVYKQKTVVYDFLRSFFPTKQSTTKFVSIAVQRYAELVAVDVERNTEGNRNKFSISTEKIIEPPYFREYYDMTELSLYDRLWSTTDDTINADVYGELVADASEKLDVLKDKIRRAIELQCANVLQTGIVTMNAGGINANINYMRKSSSFADLGSGGYWDVNSNTVDPVTSLAVGANFLRTIGKCTDGEFYIIAGQNALQALLNNTFVQNRGKIYNYALDLLGMPQRQSMGYNFHGEISIEGWRGILMSYPQFYDSAPNTPLPYIQPYNVIMLPKNPRFSLGCAAVARLYSSGPGKPEMYDGFTVSEFTDQRLSAHIVDIKAAPVPVPVAVDQIYTIKATSV